MFDTNLEKAKQESDNKIQQLKIEIAQLQTELAKQKTGLTETQATADSVEDFDDEKEIAKVREQRLDLKVKELLKV